VHILKQRAERANLQQLTDRASFDRPLSGTEEAAIHGLWRSARHHPSNSRIEAGSGLRLITSGWAGWLRCADDGRRLIFLFLMPGDYIVPALFNVHDCDLVCLTSVRTVDASPLAEAGSTATPQSSAMGSTTSSIALLLIELHERSVQSGACVNGRFSLPIGQRMLAASLGRSTVQVNKVLSKFQTDGLIRVGYDWLEVVDPTGLQSLSGMTPRPQPCDIIIHAV
jgi:CRP-like cAMP-binding protein